MTTHGARPATTPMASADRWAVWLVQQAARYAPPALSERLTEEYQADLMTQPPGLSRLGFAAGCYWASLRMSQDTLLCRAPQAVAAGGLHPPSAFDAHDATWFSRRTMVLVAILAVHAAAIYGLTLGITRNAKPLVPPNNTKGQVLVQPLPSEAAPPKIPFVSAVETVMPRMDQLPFDPAAVVMPTVESANLSDDLPSVVGRDTQHVIKRIAGGPGAGFPNARDFYSSAAVRAGLSGVTAVRVCVDGSGRLTSVPVVAASSGYPILDGDALAVARAGSGHYRSTMEDGVAITDCYSYRIRFELH